MNSLVLSLWAGNVFCDTLGQIAFKLAAIAPGNRDGMQYWLDLVRRPWLWVGVFAYVFEFLLWLAFLTLVPLSEGILLGSVNIIAVMVVGRFLFRERVTPLRLTGILLVAAGVVVVGAF
ncbi:hypothetical protein AGMMS49545_14230 [Betaproteobacteria bacterium]|nr:hypothetical protein AGMMS49545_14230 [Betaproteobacteria bacterium]GHU45795.1 hypothetical protein AGMMS50289_17710 [Betaproteobacteria bacterium]